MKNNLLFNFTVDKHTNTISVIREFNADLSLVWDTFTKQELLDQWWAPAPWTSHTSEMNFEVGGRRVYAMRGPEGEEHWSVQLFTAINPVNNFQYEDAFSDKDGVVNTSLPCMHWNLNFSTNNDITRVDIHIHAKKLKDLEQIIEMGFREGFTQTLEALDHLLQELKK